MNEEDTVATLELEDFDAAAEAEVAARGYLATARVRLANGKRIPVFFYDAVRLAQDLESERRRGRKFLAEPGMIVLTDVTRANMEAAVAVLAAEGFFEQYG